MTWLDPTLIAPLLAGVAAGMLPAASARPRLLRRRLAMAPRTGDHRAFAWLPAALSGAPPGWVLGAVIGIGAFSWLGPVAAVVGAGAGVVGARHRRRTLFERAAAARRARVVEACLALAAELRAGQPPPTALAIAAEVDPDALGMPARRAALGGDVATMLREQATRPGGQELLAVAVGWEVSERTGAGLADVISRVATALRTEIALRAETSAQLASVTATARLLAVLPVFTLLIASGAGGSPVRFLVATPYGAACLLAGALLTWLGVIWVDRLARSAVE